jgi:catechol 2,3-dioxygenase-like lactoylglutathione lyase family enzyme
MPELNAIHHVSLTVSDVDASVRWYQDVLGLTELMKEEHPDGSGYGVVLGKPDFSVCIGLHTHQTADGARFAETRTGLDHVSFLAADRDELAAWEKRLADHGVDYSPLNDQGGYAVVVFRDPDNIQLEFITLGPAA